MRPLLRAKNSPIKLFEANTGRLHDAPQELALITRLGTILFAAVLSAYSITAAAQTSESTDPLIEALRERIEALSAAGGLSVEGTPLSATRSLPAIYELHGFQPFWDSAASRSSSNSCARAPWMD